MNAKKPVLGKGLSALLPPRQQAQAAQDGLMYVAVDRIDATAGQPRRSFDEESLASLTESIRHTGIIQPLVLRRCGDRFLVVAGERRLRAARAAGLDRVPAVLREASDAEAFEVALVENLQREDLNPMEEASAYRRLIDEHGHSVEGLARRLGRDRSTIANSIRLLALPEGVVALVASGVLSAGHARALLVARAGEEAAALASRVIAEGLTVRQTERLARAVRPASSLSVAGRAGVLGPHHAAVEASLSEKLGLPVRVAGRGSKGRVVIEFRSLDELRRIDDLVEPSPKA